MVHPVDPRFLQRNHSGSDAGFATTFRRCHAFRLCPSRRCASARTPGKFAHGRGTSATLSERDGNGFMKLAWCLPLILVACVATAPDPDPPKPVSKGPEPEATPPETPKKSLAGKVTFSELGERDLARIRVIPEFGTDLFVPENRTYLQVDGFWWKNDPLKWFKIPDHGEVWVGERPESFDGENTLGGFRIYFRSLPLLGWASAMMGGVREPGWVPDSGPTRSPVSFPWNLP